MSDYIYNNFSQGEDKETSEPINIYYELDKKKPNKNSHAVTIILCTLCVLLSGVVAFLGTLLAETFSKSVIDTSAVTTNVIYQSPNIQSQTPSTSGKTVYTVAEVASAVADTVVEIQTQYSTYSSFYGGYITSGAGSGVIVGKYDEGGQKGYYIVTNAHVIEGSSSSQVADQISVILRNGTEYEATVKAYSANKDIAVLKIAESAELKVATWGSSDDLIVGEGVVAIGNPLGELGGSVTDGIVSALERDITIDGIEMKLIQTNAAINPGNSGGGLFNMSGELIGIVNAKSSGSGIEGLGFAIPQSSAQSCVSDIITYGYVTGQPYIGVQFSAYYANRERSALYYQVTSLIEGYNDDVLEIGDKIMKIEGESITSTTQLATVVYSKSVGDTISVEIERDGVTMTVDLAVKDRKNH